MCIYGEVKNIGTPVVNYLVGVDLGVIGYYDSLNLVKYLLPAQSCHFIHVNSNGPWCSRPQPVNQKI